MNAELSRYLRATHRYPLLSADEEQTLARRFRATGDRTALEKLAGSQLRLVVKIARDAARGRRDVLDLVQEGNLGLLRAIHHFDPERGIRLTTYAAYWIRAWVYRYIMANARLVKIGTTAAQRQLFFQLRGAEEALRRAGVTPDAAHVAEQLGLPESVVTATRLRMSSPDVSLDRPLGRDDPEGARVLDRVPASGASPEDQVAEAEYLRAAAVRIARFADGLRARDRDVFESRWVAERPQTLRELGRRLGISKERARQLEARVLKRMRADLEDAHLPLAAA